MDEGKKRVGLFGGSFNPVHNGHLVCAESFLESRLIHELWVLPAQNPPHKQEETLAAFPHRVEMLELAFSRYPNVTVETVESRLESPSYTIRTIEYLQAEYPEILFFLCMGEDSLNGFDQWYRFEEILQKLVLIVARRPDSDTSHVPEDILARTILLDNTPVEVSSTAVRKLGAKEWLPRDVQAYLENHRLYDKSVF